MKDGEIVVFVLGIVAMFLAFWQVGTDIQDLQDRTEALETVTATEVAP